MPMHEICRPTRAEWRAMWRYTRVFGLNTSNVPYAGPSLRLAIETRVMRELTKLNQGMPTDHQQRVAQYINYHKLMKG